MIGRIWRKIRSWPVWAQALLAFVVLAVIVGPFLEEPTEPTDSNQTEEAGEGPEDDRSPFITTKVTDFQPIDEATLQFTITWRNTGEEAAKGECTVTARDAVEMVGFDFFVSTEPINPGAILRNVGNLRIEDEGAFRVQTVEASDCEAE